MRLHAGLRFTSRRRRLQGYNWQEALPRRARRRCSGFGIPLDAALVIATRHTLTLVVGVTEVVKWWGEQIALHVNTISHAKIVQTHISYISSVFPTFATINAVLSSFLVFCTNVLSLTTRQKLLTAKLSTCVIGRNVNTRIYTTPTPIRSRYDSTLQTFVYFCFCLTIRSKMFSKIVRIAVCTSSFLYTFYVLCKLTYFLSKPVEFNESDELEAEENQALKTLWTLLMNVILLSAFIIQHSVMAMDFLKDFYYNFDIEDMERSVYNASSAAVLHLLMQYWQPIPWPSIWNFSTSQSNYLWFVISAFQVFGWCIVYAGCVMMDISELAGLKQVYYKLSGRPRPLAMKSRELQRFLTHMRHPSLTGFLIILWIYPLMSIDRLLLASILSCYMVLMWSIDYEDYSYQSIMISRKQRELNTETY